MWLTCSVQCIILCLEGLLPRDLEQCTFEMLWNLLLWYSLVKLRLQSKSTVFLLRAAVTRVGASVRKFQRETAHLDTKKLPKDEKSRGTKRRKKDDGVYTQKVPLSLYTLKWHNMVHACDDVPEVGPSDLMNTQGVSRNRIFYLVHEF